MDKVSIIDIIAGNNKVNKAKSWINSQVQSAKFKNTIGKTKLQIGFFYP